MSSDLQKPDAAGELQGDETASNKETPKDTPSEARDTPSEAQDTTSEARARFSAQWRWLSWVLMALVLATAFSFGSFNSAGPSSDGERLTALARSIRCPQCKGQSVAESNVAIAQEIRADIRTRIAEGESDQQIRQIYIDRFGRSVVLTPDGEGFVSFVWIAPVVAGGLAITAVVIAMNRWRNEADPKARRKSMQQSKTQNRMAATAIPVLIVLVAATAAGIGLARSIGYRSPTATLTGGIRANSTTLLAEADTLMREGQWAQAISNYDAVLEIDAANVEALTYKGWVSSLASQDASSNQQALATVSEAIAIDPDYADARVFAAVLAMRQDDFDTAAKHLTHLDQLETDQQTEALVEQFQLKVRVAVGQINAQSSTTSDANTLNLTGVYGSEDTEFLSRVGLQLDAQNPILALQVFDEVLKVDKDNVIALTGKGRRLGADPAVFAQAPDVAAQGLQLLERAVDLAPERNDVRLFRAFAYVVQNQPEAARKDLGLINQDELNQDLLELYMSLQQAVGS